MLTPPRNLSDEALVQALGDRWGVAVTSMEYRAVGFGSHHWEATDIGRSRWFVTVDELETRSSSVSEPEEAAFQRLRAALSTARALRDTGRNFVVAPVPTLDGAPLARLGAHFAVSLYPYVLMAPPERDLWWFDPGDDSIIDAYATATGVTPLAPTLALYRIRWDLTDLAVYVTRFRRPHAATSDDEKTWDCLSSVVSTVVGSTERGEIQLPH